MDSQLFLIISFEQQDRIARITVPIQIIIHNPNTSQTGAKANNQL